jgi:hypothetical protein
VERTRGPGQSVAVGTLLWWVGVLHQTVGLALGWDVVVAVLRDGYVGAIEPDNERMVVFWFFVAGWLMMFCGRALRAIERERALPAEFGWRLVAFGVLGGLAIPASGFWLAVPLGLVALARARAAGDRPVLS